MEEERLESRATPQATAAFARRMVDVAAPGHFRGFPVHRPAPADAQPPTGLFGPKDELVLSSLGLGTYLGPPDDATDAGYADAIRTAFQNAINVVDTAIIYRKERSERVIGRVLAEAVNERLVQRTEVFVASKGGYGESLAPGLLGDQIERSRANLGLDTIDLYYLHNPEAQLAAGMPRPEFLRRMRAAFERLEQAVADGAIGWYGIATWDGLRAPADAPGHLSLDELATLARESGGDAHHFRFVQLPFNRAMDEAWTRRNQAGGRNVLEAAADHGLYVMASASLLQGRLAARLPASLRNAYPGLESDAPRALQFVRSTPGIGTALAGMSRAGHVRENAAVAAVPPDPDATRTLLSPKDRDQSVPSNVPS